MKKRDKEIVGIALVIIVVLIGISFVILPEAIISIPAPVLDTIEPSVSNDGVITLSWSSVKYAEGYGVYRWKDGTVQELFYVSSTTLTYVDNVKASGGYYYTVRCVGRNYDSVHSNRQYVTVETPNVSPTATIRTIYPNPATQGVDTVTFSGEGSDPDGTITEYEWSLLDGTILSIERLFSKSADDFNIGDTTIYYRVKDDDGVWSDKVSEVLTIIEASNEKPTATIISIIPSSATHGEDTLISFSGSGIDSDGTITEYKWSSSIDGTLSSLSSFSESADDLSVGTHTIYFKVKDDDDAWSDEVSMSLTIIELWGNEKPIANIISIIPSSAEQEVDTIYFSGSGDDPDGTITEYEWSSSIDGTLSSLSSFSKSADDLSVGTHTIYFKVKDDDGSWSDKDSKVLTIRELGDEEVLEDSTGMIILFVVLVGVGVSSIFVARKLRKKVK